jgi:hypothetical protein
MVARAKEGADIGKQMMMLPAERQQAIAKATMDKLVSEHAKESVAQYQTLVKQIQSSTTMTPAEKVAEMRKAQAGLGMGWSGGNAEYNPNWMIQNYPGLVSNPKLVDPNKPAAPAPAPKDKGEVIVGEPVRTDGGDGSNTNPAPSPSPSPNSDGGVLQKNRRLTPTDTSFIPTNPSNMVVSANGPNFNPINPAIYYSQLGLPGSPTDMLNV